MNKVRKKFVWYAMLAIFALLTVMLSIINGVNFTMASNDADMITQMLSEKHGSFSESSNKPGKGTPGTNTPDTPVGQTETSGSSSSSGTSSRNKRMGPMGPDSPEMNSSVRYFTYAFDENGNAQKVAFKISAVEEEEAVSWARSLINENTGWTRGTYRYRVYTEGDKTYVTVIDQGRELLPSYRILIISICGEAVGLVLSFIVLRLVGKRLFKPLEEADRKQKKFIANIESDFKVPLTIINANTEIIEKENGSSDYTKSINRQVKKMIALVKDIGSLAIFEEKNAAITKVNLSSTLSALLDYNKTKFAEKDFKLGFDIENDIIIDGEEEAIKKLFSELIRNSLKYSISKSEFTLKKEKDRIIITQTNDTSLPSGSIDQIFDRFTILGNAENTDAIGLGLSYVKDIAKAHDGRVGAKVSDGLFVLKIAL